MQITRTARVLPLVLLMGLAATSASADVYKCPDSGGKHKFQDTPCTGGSLQTVKPVTIDATPGYQNQSPGTTVSSDPMVGMGKNHLISVLGNPDRSTLTTSVDGSKIESLTFMQHGKAIVAYLENGFVFNTATTEKDWIKQAGNVSRNCPSATYIRNAETSAGSITLTDRQRRDKQYEIGRMKACLSN